MSTTTSQKIEISTTNGNMEDLEALLTDLQNTTANLKKANLSSRYQHQTTSTVVNGKPQKATVTTMAASTSASRYQNIGLQDLEQLLEDYTIQRGKQQAAAASSGRPTVESLLGELDTAVANGDEIRSSHSPSQMANKEITITLKKLEVADNQTNGGTIRHSRSPEAKPAVSDPLDSMLGTLENDLSKQGISTMTKGDCTACNKSIVGQVVIALGKMWHPEHFSCSHCGDELAHQNFFERSGRAYCENDYHNLFSPRCNYCNGPIKDKCITALEQTWHPEHFICNKCGKQFGEEGFHEKDGQAYCREDYLALYAAKCKGCDHPITDKYITALSTQWHPECFVCQECKRRFTDGCGSYFDHDGQPYCETHYHEKRGSLCAGCHKPISGRCVTAMGKKFHPEHFVCSFCLGPLNKGTFKEHEFKPYCHKCFNKLFN